MLIHKCRCDASRALKMARRCCLQCHMLLELIIIDLLNDSLNLYSLSMQGINHLIQIRPDLCRSAIWGVSSVTSAVGVTTAHLVRWRHTSLAFAKKRQFVSIEPIFAHQVQQVCLPQHLFDKVLFSQHTLH